MKQPELKTIEPGDFILYEFDGWDYLIAVIDYDKCFCFTSNEVQNFNNYWFLSNCDRWTKL